MRSATERRRDSKWDLPWDAHAIPEPAGDFKRGGTKCWYGATRAHPAAIGRAPAGHDSTDSEARTLVAIPYRPYHIGEG